MTAQIAATLHGREATLCKEFAHRLGLVETVFQQQPATGQQMRRRLLDDGPTVGAWVTSGLASFYRCCCARVRSLKGRCDMLRCAPRVCALRP